MRKLCWGRALKEDKKKTKACFLRLGLLGLIFMLGINLAGGIFQGVFADDPVPPPVIVPPRCDPVVTVTKRIVDTESAEVDDAEFVFRIKAWNGDSYVDFTNQHCSTISGVPTEDDPNVYEFTLKDGDEKN